MIIKEPGLLRGCPIFDTYKGNFYFNGNNKIVGLESNEINGGKLIGEKTIKKFTLGVGNLVKGIIENNDYESIEGLFEEINFAYSQKIKNVLEKNNKQVENAA